MRPSNTFHTGRRVGHWVKVKVLSLCWPRLIDSSQLWLVVRKLSKLFSYHKYEKCSGKVVQDRRFTVKKSNHSLEIMDSSVYGAEDYIFHGK